VEVPEIKCKYCTTVCESDRCLKLHQKQYKKAIKVLGLPIAKVKVKKGAKVKDQRKHRKIVNGKRRPSKALSGFNLFFKAESKRTQEAGEKLTYGTFGPHMGAKWAGMGASEKAPFMEEAKKDSER